MGRSKASARFSKENVLALVINLGVGPHANTLSLFINGLRQSDPHPLPDELKGKTLYPCITYRNVNLEVNFGPALMKDLPSTCRSLQDAAVADMEVPKATKPRRNEVI